MRRSQEVKSAYTASLDEENLDTTGDGVRNEAKGADTHVAEADELDRMAVP